MLEKHLLLLSTENQWDTRRTIYNLHMIIIGAVRSLVITHWNRKICNISCIYLFPCDVKGREIRECLWALILVFYVTYCQPLYDTVTNYQYMNDISSFCVGCQDCFLCGFSFNSRSWINLLQLFTGALTGREKQGVIWQYYKRITHIRNSVHVRDLVKNVRKAQVSWALHGLKM